ncbi:MAG: 30S ribosomal protein S7 [Candidatus Shapirobacteria bacterium]|nr:30S ribosomal protein S7 [Candidatus Shapirobacteria bacterium]
MSRKGQSKIRDLNADTVYNSVIISRIINYAMRDGKKNAAEKQVYKALDILKKEFPNEDVLVTTERALENIKPKVEVRPRRIGGAVYQVPTPVRGHRQNSLAIRWLVSVSRDKSNKQFHSFGEKLASELIAAIKNEGQTISKRTEVERMAEANKAFAHLRW